MTAVQGARHRARLRRRLLASPVTFWLLVFALVLAAFQYATSKDGLGLLHVDKTEQLTAGGPTASVYGKFLDLLLHNNSNSSSSRIDSEDKLQCSCEQLCGIVSECCAGAVTEYHMSSSSWNPHALCAGERLSPVHHTIFVSIIAYRVSCGQLEQCCNCRSCSPHTSRQKPAVGQSNLVHFGRNLSAMRLWPTCSIRRLSHTASLPACVSSGCCQQRALKTVHQSGCRPSCAPM
jgi:hypothetical protein